METTIKGEEARQYLQQLNDELLPKKFGTAGKLWVVLLLTVIATGLFFYVKQLKYGLSITGLGDYVSWGIYISNFVFFVAASLVGSLITAILYLLNVKWRAPLTRISEVIAVAAIMFAGLIIIVDMGRPDRLHHIFLYGRIQSPILWDIIVITTYMTISILLLYFPLLPGIAYCRDHLTEVPGWQKKMYKILALGWKGTKEQFHIIKRSVMILSVLIIPVALSIHTVTSWLFATTFRPGWDSTNFGAYFVSGAFMLGAAAVIAGMYVFWKAYPHYSKYITEKHFDRMGKLLVLLSLVYLYFTVNEYLVPGYKMKQIESDHLESLFVGHYAPMFWAVQIFGMIIPIIALLFKRFRKPGPMFVIALMVIIGGWFKRFLIVIPTMLHPFLPMQEVPKEMQHYMPTFAEWSITLASLAAALLVITFFVRYFPILSIWEIAEEKGIELEDMEMNDEKNKVPVSRAAAVLVLFTLFSANVFASGENDSTAANDTETKEKISAKMSLKYTKKADGTETVKISVWYKENKKNIPVENAVVNLYLDEVSKEGMLTNIITDENGEGTIVLPDRFYNRAEGKYEYLFIGRMMSEDLYQPTEEEITVKRAEIMLTASDKDSSITAVIRQIAGKDSILPVPEAEVKIGVRRTFSILPVGDPLTSDESGTVSVICPSGIPGDSIGNITIVARIEEHDEFGTIESEQEVIWGMPVKAEVHEGRTLWSSGKNAPVPLVTASMAIVAGIWSVLIYLMFQLYRIKKSGRK